VGARQDFDAPPELRNVPVLVVDDNATNRQILVETLQHWGMHVTAVDGARPALAALNYAMRSATPFDLVLLDVMMPEIDGFGLAERIRQQPVFYEVRLLMLSSAAHPPDRPACERLGIAAYLTKPVKQSELLRAILSAMQPGAGETRREPVITAVPHALPPLRILLAEDNPVNQRLAIRLLEKQGHSVHVVPSGRLAVETVEEHDYDVVLMDIEMPEMDGLEATRRIREREQATGRRTPIIAMTAHAMKGDEEKCLEAGMDSYLTKPIQLADLWKALATHVVAFGAQEVARATDQGT
jgi:CheY-like chemotaxis protein